jgi:hypothetical protein
MIYTCFVLVVGIFIGQEYDTVPSVKTMVLNLANFLASHANLTVPASGDDSHTSWIGLVNMLKHKNE